MSARSKISQPAGKVDVSIPQKVTHAGDTRLALMDLIKRNGEMDVAGLAQALGISNVAVRQHLAGLEKSGEVAQRVVHRPVGRPARLYQLTEIGEKAFPQTSDGMAIDLLTRLEKQLGPEAIEKLFEARIKDLSKQYRERMKGAKSLADKWNVLAEIRDEEGYLCTVKPAADGSLKLVEHHCPVREIASRFPQVCRFELELFRRVLGDNKLERVEHILAGQHACCYVSKSKKA